MRSKILAITISAVLAFGCGKDRVLNKSCLGNPDAQTLVHDGETREYLLYVPASYDGSTKVPLMFNFHGYGGNADRFMNYGDMRPVADSENFILVYPQGSCLDGVSHWNAGLNSPDNKSEADDLGFVEAMIDELSANYNIDSERIYAAGYSNGAVLSYALACYRSDLIAAIGSVSGTMLEETVANCNALHPTAMINIHGSSDKVVSYTGSEGYASIETVLNHWISFNKTNTSPVLNSVNDGGTIIEHYAYTDGDSGTAVEHYKVVGGRHLWFDLNYQGANTSRLIWDFVSRYDINGLR